MIPFLDVSSNNQHQGIDWPKLTDWLLAIHPEGGVIVKVNEFDYVNEFLHQQRQGAHAAGIKNVGLYEYGRPSLGSGSQGADLFLQAVGSDGDGVVKGEFYCLDVEDVKVPSNADLDAYVLDNTGRKARSSGLSQIVYSGDWYAQPHNLTRDPRLAELGLWWAAPGAVLPTTPEPWRGQGKSILIWQYDWHGKVPGVTGDVDLNWLMGPIDVLRPYQWGFQADPLTVTDEPLDVDVPLNSERLEDIQKVAAMMRSHTEAIASAKPGAQLAGLARQIKSEADYIVRATWGH